MRLGTKKETEMLEEICGYCEYATVLGDSGACVCKKRGAVRADSTCRRFRQDLLKVKPHLPFLPDTEDLFESL